MKKKIKKDGIITSSKSDKQHGFVQGRHFYSEESFSEKTVLSVVQRRLIKMRQKGKPNYNHIFSKKGNGFDV